MPSSLIFNTDSEKVALVAVAWEIVEMQVINHFDSDLAPVERKRIVTNAFIDVYQALLKAKQLEENDDALIKGAYLFSNGDKPAAHE